MTNPIPHPAFDLNVSYQQLLEYDESTLTLMYHHFLEEAVKSSDNHSRDASQELLLMMEDAPELKAIVKKIKISTHNELEKKCADQKMQLEERREKKIQANHLLLQLKTQYRQVLTQKEAKEKAHTHALQKLELIRQHIQEIKTSPKRQWMDQSRQWEQQIHVAENNQKIAKEQWQTSKEEFLTLCLPFLSENKKDHHT